MQKKLWRSHCDDAYNCKMVVLRCPYYVNCCDVLREGDGRDYSAVACNGRDCTGMGGSRKLSFMRLLEPRCCRIAKEVCSSGGGREQCGHEGHERGLDVWVAELGTASAGGRCHDVARFFGCAVPVAPQFATCV